MAKPRLRLAVAAERIRESLWFIPGLMVGASALLASFLVSASGPAPKFPMSKLLLPETADAAATLLQVVAASVITVTSVVFSLTVVALQITAGNYSPRALRTFLRDLGTQLVLGTFLATFAYSYLVLQNVAPASQGQGAWVPQWAFAAIPGFVLASLIALVFFIHHVTQAIRVDLILLEVMKETLESIDSTHPESDDEMVSEAPRDLVPERAAEVKSGTSGFVQKFALEDLTEVLRERELVAAFRPTVGDHLLEGGALAWVWREEGSDPVEPDEELTSAIRDAVQAGRERSMNQDVAYGIRQLVDIAVRALSPGVNDPNSAVAAILHLSVTYRALLERRLGAVVANDSRGSARVMVPYPTLEEYLFIMCQQVGHYGRADSMVILRLLRELAELKALAPKHHHEAIDSSIDVVLREAEQGIDIAENLEVIRCAAHDAHDQTFRFRHYTAAG